MDFRTVLYAAGLAGALLAPQAMAVEPAAKSATTKPAPAKPASIKSTPAKSAPAKSAAADTDCKQARALPPEADAAARRIVCEIPPQYQEDVSRAEVLGALLRRHDLAAWLSSDALVEAGAMRSIPGEPQGWLSLERGDRIDVRYFSRDGGRMVAFAESSLPLRAPLKAQGSRRLDPPQAADDRELRLLAAIKLARAQKMTYCSEAPPNTVAVEFAEPGGPMQILVFLMSPWDDRGAPLGGHALFRIARDGGKVVERFEQTRSCVNLPAKDLTAAQALTVSHLTSPTPTFFHAFMSRQYDKPIVVSTTQNGLIWKVENGQIRLLAEDAPERKAIREAERKPAKP